MTHPLKETKLKELRKRYPDKPIICTEIPLYYSVHDPSMMAIMQEMGGYLAGFCLYCFAGIIVQRYRVDPGNMGKIVRTDYGVFDRHRRPVPFNDRKPVHFDVDDEILQKCKTKVDVYRNALKAYRVRDITHKVASSLVTNRAAKRISMAKHFGLEQ